MDKKTYNEAKFFRNNSIYVAILLWLVFIILHRPPAADFTIIGVAATIITVLSIVLSTITSYYKNLTNKDNKE